MIKIINKYCSMKVSGKDIPANTEVCVSDKEYQHLCVIYPDIRRILEKTEPKTVIIQDKTYEIQKKKKKKRK